MQSNHCRAIAVIASQLGIKSHLLLLSDTNENQSVCKGNLLLSRLCDANIYVIPVNSKIEDALIRQEALKKEIFRRTGEEAYVMFPGGSDLVGLYGYIHGWQEMMEQGVRDKFDDIVVVCGSGGTVAALAIGNYLTGQQVKVHGVSDCFDAGFFHDHINEALSEIRLDDVRSEDIVDIIDNYTENGTSSQATEEDLNLYTTIAATTGIFCDPNFTGRGVKGLISELNSKPTRFKGERVLFIHTGGIFGMCDGSMFSVFSNDKVHDWTDIERSAKELL